MDPIPSYPVADFGPAMKGMVIGGVGILHVFLAQFAIGGGFLMLAFERTAQRSTEPVLKEAARRFVAGYFKTLVLVSFVLGALTGVAMWLVSVQVSARTLGLMIDEFSEAAHRENALKGEAGAEARRLEDAMTKAGFVGMPTEWWHYDAPDASKYGFADVPLDTPTEEP